MFEVGTILVVFWVGWWARGLTAPKPVHVYVTNTPQGGAFAWPASGQGKKINTDEIEDFTEKDMRKAELKLGVQGWQNQ